MSEHGALLDALLVRAHWLVGGVLALAVLLTLWLTLGARLPRPRAPGRWLAVAMAAIVLFVVDFTLATGSRRALSVLAADAEHEPNALRIEINARRWAWDVRYPGADGRFATPDDASPDDIVLTNELVVPVGAPVILQVAAMDVVHAFNIPTLRVQVEAIPGHLGHTWFRALAPGELALACAQHCGPAHYRMRGVVRVLSAEEFAAWAARRQRIAELGFDPADTDARWGLAVALSGTRLIARVYVWAGLVFLAVGGGLAMLIRWQWAYPGRPVPLVGPLLFPAAGGAVTPDAYQALFTMHGLIMIFFAVTPVLISALSHWLVPAMIGARTLAYPRAAWLGLVLFLAAQALMLGSFFVELGTARGGWTLYPPLSAVAPGLGQTLVVAALALASISTAIGAVNVLVTVLGRRAPGMTWGRLPFTVWGLFLTAVLTALFSPVLVAAGLLLLSDRVLGSEIFVAGVMATRGGGDPLAFQHLFWIFGHPEVYILILPVWGVVSDFVAFFTRREAFWYRGTVAAMIGVTVLSGVVYGHHLFTAGLAPLLGATFEALTLAISVPSTLLFGTWLLTLWHGRVRLTVPMLYVTGVLLVFAAGGLTGLHLAAIGTDIVLHDTLWVVGHFHLTMAAATFLGLFAALHHWAPQLFGCTLGDRLGRLHAVLSLLGLFLVFGGMLVSGLGGQHRRLYDPFVSTVEVLASRSANRHTSFSAFGLAAVQLLFVLNLIHSLLTRRVAVENPWHLGTLEWQEGKEISEVKSGPHVFLSGDDEKEAGKDFVSQSEACPQKRDAGVKN